jgi:hypothetical protein
MTPGMQKWILYNVVVCFAVYWLSNLILWYPWSVNEQLGQILMLTVNPVLWGFASYICLKKYPEPGIAKGVFLNGLVFITEAVVSDLILFAGIQHAMDKLMHRTTFYGWAFVATVPFLIFLLFKKRLLINRIHIQRKDFNVPVAIGLFSFITIAIILIFHIRFH